MKFGDRPQGSEVFGNPSSSLALTDGKFALHALEGLRGILCRRGPLSVVLVCVS